jgi:hypothetical protein
MSYIGRKFVPQSTIDRRVQRKDDRCARELRARTARLEAAAQLLAPVTVDEPRDDDQDERDELSGSTCSAGCGFCGRCS